MGAAPNEGGIQGGGDLRRSICISIDCRYIRERPSGIGAYVRALLDRLPAIAPADRFHLWVDPRARRPLTPFPSVREAVVRAPANSLPTLLWPSRLVDLGGADVLHAPFNILGRGVRCATVVTVHDLIWILSPTAAEGLSLATPFQAAFYRDGIWRALRRATRVVTISKATADSILFVAPEARRRLCVIPHGVDARFRPPETLARAQGDAARILGTEAPYFLVVGQNAPFKNHEQILEAFAASGLGAKVKLVLLQRLYSGERLKKRVIELGIEGSTIWLQSATEDQVVTLLQGALALVQFSRFEGFGMPAAEAMACGTPVIASAIPALVEVLGGAGIHVDLSPSELARALRRIAGEPGLRAELSGLGLERARELSWDRSARAHLEAYHAAAEEGPLRGD
jgi:glycosyltransferase involved in cell wall biosynthesis